MLCSCPEVAASPRVHRFQVFIFFFSESSRCICNFFPQLQPGLFIYFLFFPPTAQMFKAALFMLIFPVVKAQAQN